MQLGYNTNGFTSHSLEDAIRVIGGIGYQAISITIDHHALDPRQPDLDGRVRRCRALLAEYGLACVIETGGRFLLDPWRKHRPTLLESDDAERAVRREFLRGAIEIAGGVGAKVVSMWSGSQPEQAHASTRELDERLAGELIGLCDYAAERGLVVGFEPEPGMHIQTMSDYDRISRAVAHPAFQLTLDVGHAHLTEECGAADTVRRWRNRIVNVHLEGMERPFHDHLPPWDGDMDVRAVIAALRASGYSGPAAFELSRHSHAAVDIARRAFEFATT
jgi:sugar phosphate isomerase/epimerase